MISGHADRSTGWAAARKGAFDFLDKPLDEGQVLVTVRNALAMGRAESEVAALRGKVAERWRILGGSAAVREVLATLEKVGPTQARVLVTGGNGTGKELVARNVHERSGRWRGPFVEVNCAAIPRELVESELFGHEKGAFTGAVGARAGKFEQADGGTIFLDEIGDMDLAAQAKVLRALEEGTIERVGGRGPVSVDVRVVAATNKDLQEEVAKGRFREDLRRAGRTSPSSRATSSRRPASGTTSSRAAASPRTPRRCSSARSGRATCASSATSSRGSPSSAPGRSCARPTWSPTSRPAAPRGRGTPSSTARPSRSSRSGRSGCSSSSASRRTSGT